MSFHYSLKSLKVRNTIEIQIEQKLKESEERFRIIADQSLTGICIIQDESVIYANDKLSEISEYSKQEIQKWSITDILKSAYHEDLQLLTDKLEERQRSKFGSVMLFTFRFFTKSGKIKWVKISSKSILYQGKPSIIASLIDVTGKKEAEQKLKESENKLDVIISSLPDQIAIIDKNFNIIIVNDRVKELFGSSVVGNKCYKIYHDSDNVCEDCLVKKTFKDGKIHHTECERIGIKGGKMNCWCISSVAARDENGEPSLVVEVSRDISERKIAEQKLRESELKYRSLFESSTEGIASDDMNGNLIDANNAFLDMLGYSREELINLTYTQLTPQKWYKMEEEIRKTQLMIKGYTDIYEKEYVRKDSTIIPVSIRGWLKKNEKGEPIGVWVFVREITNRKMAEQKLKESEEKFRNIADQSLIGICILQDGVIKYVNQHLSEIYGYTIEEIKNWAPGEFIKVFHPEDKDMVLDQALKKQSELTDVANHYQFRAIKRTGETIWIENFSKTIIHDGKTANLVAIIDITERKKVENALKEREHDLRDSLKEIRNSEKNLKDLMEAIPIGVLVSSPNGEIHDLNSQTLEIFGYNSKDEFLKISTQDHYYDPKEGEKFIASMIKEGFIKDFRALFKRKDGTLIWGLVNSISQVNNKQTLFINTFQDISDRIKAEEEIADLAKFPSENPNPVLRVNEEFVLYVNNVGQNLFKVKEGNRIPNLLREIIRKAFEDYKLRQVEVNLNNRVYSLVITPVKGTGYINIYGMDITKRIQAEKMLRKFKIS